jgi:hypothetical protein
VSPGKTPLADGARMDLIFGDIVTPGGRSTETAWLLMSALSIPTCKSS